MTDPYAPEGREYDPTQVSQQPAPVQQLAAQQQQVTAPAYNSGAYDGRAYDSRDRRDAMAADMTGRGIDEDLVRARMLADVSQAKPATAITNNQPERTQPTGQQQPHQRDRQPQQTQQYPGLQR